LSLAAAAEVVFISRCGSLPESQVFSQGATVNKVAFCLAGVCLIGLVQGCGPGGPTLVPAEGVVTLAGTPLDDANLTIHYADGNVAQDVTHGGGKFSLSYMGKPGAVAGSKLKVSVAKYESAYAATAVKRSGSGGGPPSDEEYRKNMKDAEKIMQEASKSTQSGKKSAGGPKNEIDVKYANPASSGLEVTIPDAGAKDLKIDLK
jgi:hypothetical protein